ncbi:DNA repair-scaffolding protein-like [Octodon degus]|uniref:DNA repair-scaffolding protein-like n=1 Tax=Octodon degus TaxID=10160 RepID=A0A6P6EMC5_OCTDE|nr:DNA repair-scaffolding protein-like [Octodon degus]
MQIKAESWGNSSVGTSPGSRTAPRRRSADKSRPTLGRPPIAVNDVVSRGSTGGARERRGGGARGKRRRPAPEEMPRGGACGPKRKRTWDSEYPSFPEERPLQSQRTGLRTVGEAASLSDTWLTCGEGFQGTSGNQLLTNEKATTTGKNLKFSRRPRKEAITYNSTTELTDITWSSSGSDLSDEDEILPKSQKDNGHGSKIDRFCNRNILSPEEGASEDELQFIDWEIDSDREDAIECNEYEDGDGAVEISDCASCASSNSLASEKSSDLLKIGHFGSLQNQQD